jgi:uncharacterized protein YdaU (DUF1376 family)
MPRDDERYPHFPLWVNHFLADPAVQDMIADAKTTERGPVAVGAYFLLLLRAWFERRPGTLANDEQKARETACMTKVSEQTWKNTFALLSKAFRISKDGTRLEQKRMMREHKKIRTSMRRMSEGGKQGAQKRWGGHSTPMQHTIPEQSIPIKNTPQPPASRGGPESSSTRRSKRPTKAERVAEAEAARTERLATRTAGTNGAHA